MAMASISNNVVPFVGFGIGTDAFDAREGSELKTSDVRRKAFDVTSVGMLNIFVCERLSAASLDCDR